MTQDIWQGKEAEKGVGEGAVGKRPYESPAIIYTTQITTRAGSPLSIDKGGADEADPADLFGE